MIREEYRGFNIHPDGGFNMKRIKTIGRGTVPEHMRGLYTSSGIAMKEIDTYLLNGNKTNGKAKADDRSN